MVSLLIRDLDFVSQTIHIEKWMDNCQYPSRKKALIFFVFLKNEDTENHQVFVSLVDNLEKRNLKHLKRTHMSAHHMHITWWTIP
jgi:hypothetical protein